MIKQYPESAERVLAENHSVLSGFWNNLASHVDRCERYKSVLVSPPATVVLGPQPVGLPLDHSNGYAPAGDRPTCFASLLQNSGSR
jgi:hypothetical protein